MLGYKKKNKGVFMKYYEEYVRDTEARHLAIAKAKKILEEYDQEKKWIILDCETTGLGGDAQPIEIAVIDLSGEVLLETRIKPYTTIIGFDGEMIDIDPICEGATAVHGIRLADLQNEKYFHEIYPAIEESIKAKNILIYNAKFDSTILKMACLNKSLKCFSWHRLKCLMEIYSLYVGEWSYRWNNYRWQKAPYSTHSALADCQGSLRLLNEIASTPIEEILTKSEYPSIEIPF